MVYYLVWST